MATLQELSEAIQKGSAPKAKELTTALLAAGTRPLTFSTRVFWTAWKRSASASRRTRSTSPKS